MKPCEYYFGDYRLDPAVRELWRDDRLLSVPPRVFDLLIYLIERQDRAVSHDELIDALWGRLNVADRQVSQLVMRARRLLRQKRLEDLETIRTVYGFGYRWVMDTTVVPPSRDGDDAAGSVAVTKDQEPVNQSSAPESLPRFSRQWRLAGILVVGAALLAGVSLYLSDLPWLLPAGPAIPDPGETVVVLPLRITGESGADDAWVRLGAMDLIAERLREAGLSVSPSDSVVAAWHAVADLPEERRLETLRDTLDADLIVQGRVKPSIEGWILTLDTINTGGNRWDTHSGPAEIVLVARQAADALLLELGSALPMDSSDDEMVSEVVQRARAAMLSMELAAARSILTRVPQSQGDHPDIRYQLAAVELRVGRLNRARSITDTLLADPAVMERPRLQAETLMLRGWTAARNQEDWVSAEQDFDHAVRLLEGGPWTLELGKALGARGAAKLITHRFDAAANDLGQARLMLRAAGDRQSLAVINNYFGHLETERRRLTDALPYFQSAIEISESFGDVDSVRSNLSALLNTQMHLLRWSDALETSHRLWDMRGRIEDPGVYNFVKGHHARVLVNMGRQAEAEALLAGIGDPDSNGSVYSCYGYQALAELAWQRGHYEDALAVATRALELWPVELGSYSYHRSRAALLQQRAALAVDQGHPPERGMFSTPRGTPASEDENLPAYLIARAEWAAHQGDHEQAEQLFQRVAVRPEVWQVPSTTILFAEAYAQWLLGQGRIAEASALAGRIANWAEYDFGTALLQVAVLHAAGQREAWTIALEQARNLAGERSIPARLESPPAGEQLAGNGEGIWRNAPK